MANAGISEYSSSDASMLPPKQAHTGGRITVGDGFVLISTGLVAMALAVGFVVQMSMSIPSAAALAGGVMGALLLGHIALRVSDHRRKRTLKTQGNSATRDLRDPADLDGFAPERITAKPHVDDTAKRAAALLEKSENAERLSREKNNAGDALAAPAAEFDDMRLTRDASAREPDLNQLDLGKFRPRSPADLEKTSEQMPKSDDREASNIDDMIKRLANDIEAGRKLPLDAEATTDSRAGPIPKGVRRDMDNREPPPLSPFPTTAQSMPISVGTDHPVAHPPSLTSGDGPSGSTGKPAPAFPPDLRNASVLQDAPEPVPTASAKLAAVADALSDEQMDVFLETINGLDDYRAQHYEVSVRLNLTDGSILNNDAYIAETRGTGLLPLIEAVKVSSTKRLAVQMIRRGRTGEFFSAIDGEALGDRQFSDDVQTIAAGDRALAGRLVLSFSQADVRRLTKAQHETLEAIAKLGFRFSVEEITDLDMDFDELSRRGFAFAKLDANVFLGGLPIGTGHVPAADICRHLSNARLMLIVGKIEDEAARVQIRESGVLLGQGALFGAPRPVRSSVLRPSDGQSHAAR